MLAPFALLAALSSAHAATLAGVNLPDSASVGGQTLALNGLGLREKFYIDIYVGGLYLVHPSHDAAAIIAADEPKRIVMHFVYAVTRAQISDSFNEGFAGSPGATPEQVQQVLAAMPDSIATGQEVVIDYVPGKGTTFSVAGRQVTVPGVPFMKALFGIFVGAKPPTADLKAGLLGR